jgi:hypothetical protein
MLRHILKYLLAPIIAIGLLSSCTPLQIAQFEAEHNVVVPADVRTELLHDEEVKDYINSLPYSWGSWEPARLAWRTMMFEHKHWSWEKIDRNEAWAEDLIMKESGGCWNITGNSALVFPVNGCQLAKQGSGEDSGFGQITSAGWGPRGTVCKLENLCSSAEVVASPYDSMRALATLMDVAGKFPWCFNNFAREYHNCSLYVG